MGSTQGAADGETADPDTISPTPSPSPSVTPSPPLPQEQDDVDDNYQHTVAMNPPPMSQNASTDYLPIDHNLPNLLRKVTGNADLKSIRDIKLQVISREMSLQRLSLFIPNLKELSLDGSCLGSLRDLGCELASLHVLRVSRCGLESLDGTFGLSSLRELYASNNQVCDISPCSSLPNILIIDLCKNNIDDINSVEYLRMCRNLTDLRLSECPVVYRPNYRSKVNCLLPNLITLDGVPMAEDGDPICRGNDYNYDEGARNERRNIFTKKTSGSRGVNSPQPRFGKNLPQHEYGTRLPHPPCEINLPQPQPCTSQNISINSFESLDYSSSCKKEYKDNWFKSPAPKIRPATTGSANKSSCFKTQETLSKRRPVSSSAVIDNGETSNSGVGDHQSDSPSILTSGMVLCGNPILALRNRRRRTDAWTDADQDSQQEVSGRSQIESAGKEIVFCENAENAREINETLSEDSKCTTDILEESKKWRELFTEYRSQNRLRWEKEKDDARVTFVDGAAAYTNSRNGDNLEIKAVKPNKNVITARKVVESKKVSMVMKKFQDKNAICCPHLFSRQKSTNNSSSDTDSNSNLPAQNMKTTRKKKAL